MGAVPKLERRDLLRRAALERRNGLSGEDASRWSQQIQASALALDCYHAAPAIAIYSPIQNEVDTASLFDDALASGKRVYLPRWVGREFGFSRVVSRSELAAGRLGILEPIGVTGWIGGDNQHCLVFVPGVVFDIRGNRLGRGAGYYDRLLAQFCGNARIAGLAYEFQIVEAVPAQEWDIGMHLIVTEERTIDCGLNLRQARAASMGN